MKKRCISYTLALVFVLNLCTAAVFAKGMPFTDVSRSDWYYDDVQSAYENRLIDGKGEKNFAPDENLTCAEAVKLAACMHQRYTVGRVTLKNGSPWYQLYVDYAKFNGIIVKEYDWDAYISRADYMNIFARALPQEALTPINEVPDDTIPDVYMKYELAEGIYTLYRAGIVQGSDAEHNCFPVSNIRRSEVAAILTRMMDSSKRVRFSLGGNLRIVEQPQEDIQMPEDGMTIELYVKIEGGKAPYTYTWTRSKGMIDGGEQIAVQTMYEKEISLKMPWGNAMFSQLGTDVLFLQCIIEDSAGNAAATDPVAVYSYYSDMNTGRE